VFGASKSAVEAVEEGRRVGQNLAPKREEGEKARLIPISRDWGGTGALNGSAAEQLAANLNFSALAKAEELKKRIWFTLGALLVYRFAPTSRCLASTTAWEHIFAPRRRHPPACSNVCRRWHPPHGDLCVEHHAVHFGLDHHSVDDDCFTDGLMTLRPAHPSFLSCSSVGETVVIN